MMSPEIFRVATTVEIEKGGPFCTNISKRGNGKKAGKIWRQALSLAEINRRNLVALLSQLRKLCKVASIPACRAPLEKLRKRRARARLVNIVSALKAESRFQSSDLCFSVRSFQLSLLQLNWVLRITKGELLRARAPAKNSAERNRGRESPTALRDAASPSSPVLSPRPLPLPPCLRKTENLSLPLKLRWESAHHHRFLHWASQ